MATSLPTSRLQPSARVVFAAIGTALTILAAPLPLLAQGATIGIYTDQSGSTCSFAGNEPGTFTAYVVCRPDISGVAAVEFAAPVPPCLGAVIEEEIPPTGALVIGSVETGVSIAFQSCSTSPRLVLKLTISRSGATTPCCEYPILPDPTRGIISAVNCSGGEVQTTGLVSYFNADASCACVGNHRPSIPDNPNPPDNAEGVTRRPTLSWMSSDLDGDLAEYDLYLGTTPTPPLAAAHLTQPSYLPPLLDELTRYYWRVVARDDMGLETSGATWTFTTRPADSPPNPPQGPTIGIYTDQSGSTCSFSGNQPGTFTAYVVCRPDLSGVAAVEFAAPVPPCLGAVIEEEIVPTGALVIGSVETGISIAFPTCSAIPRVVLKLTILRSGATDPCCAYPIVAHPTTGIISTLNCSGAEVQTTGLVSHFNADASCPCVGNSAPSLPGYPIPPHNAEAQSRVLTMGWSCSDVDGNLAEYDLYLGTNPVPPLAAAHLAQPSYLPPLLEPSTRYYWRVVARDGLGLETSGATWAFTTRPANSPPYPPADPSPKNGALNVPLAAGTLTWVGYDIDGDSLAYDVYFGTTPTPPLVATGLAAESYSLPSLSYGTTYYWRVVARDPLGLGTSGPVWKFVTRPSNFPPSAPTYLYPVGIQDVPVNVTLTWEASDPEGDPLVFDVYLAPYSVPVLPSPVAAGLTANSYSVTGLAFSTWYFWQIVARDDHGNATPGRWTGFQTRPDHYNSAPSAPSNPNPPDRGGTTLLSPTLIWTATDADHQLLYHSVYFGTTSDPPLVASGLTKPTYAPGPLEVRERYYWRVVVSDGNLSTSGPLWTFQTVQRGDVDGDDVTTLADASCALHFYVGDVGCAIGGGGGGGDVDCSSSITPRDARCIHKQVIDGSCTFCENPGQRPNEKASAPTVAVGAMWEIDDTLNVNLTVEGVPWMESFGFAVLPTDPSTQVVGVMRSGVTSAFEAFAGGPWPPHVRVGGYTLSGVQATSTVDFVLLRFVRSTNSTHYVTITGFVDDLADARAITFALIGGGNVPGPFTRFEAVPADGGVDVRWDLLSDEAIKDFVLYRSEGKMSQAKLIGQGQVGLGAGSYLDRSAAAGTTYRYEMLVRTVGGGQFRSRPAMVTTATGVLVLGQNHPNPFNPQTVIPYELPRSETAVRVRLRIHDLTGRIVRTLVDEDQAGGPRQAVWNGRDQNGGAVSSGVYFSVLQAGNERRTRKLVLLK